MKNPFFGRKIHFIGIGGTSMSALAKLYKSLGNEVSGSDAEYSAAIIELVESGIDAYVGLNVDKALRADVIVYSSAIPRSDAELGACMRCGKKCCERHEFLGITAAAYDNVIAVSGTHGKTTTCGLIAAVFKNAGMPMTAHIGGKVKDLAGNFFASGDRFFVTEACEYRKSFLSLSPDTAVILNVEADHPDCYSDLDEVKNAFENFAEKVRKNGLIVVNGAIEYSFLHKCKNVHILKTGFDKRCDCYADNIIQYGGKCEYDIILNKEYYARVVPSLCGKHNILNVLAAVAVADYYGVDKKCVTETVERFGGVNRRFEYAGSVNGAKIILDYAHHPSEIEATITTAILMPHRNLRVYFQPHTYSRTEKYFVDFCRAFKWADELAFVKTCSAREKPEDGKSAFDLFYYINSYVQEAKYFDTLIDAAANICGTAMPDDLILLLGAGDIDKITELLPFDG